MKKNLIALLVFMVVVSLSSTAYANLQMDYYTYNGFDPVVSAWQFAAMVFNNTDYKSLFMVVIVIGMLFGAAALYYKLLTSQSGDPIAWIWPALAGLLLYLGIFSPKGTINIYDPVLNKYQPVNGVPDGIIAIAGSLNLLERGIVDIIASSNPPLSYKEAAGGIGFDSLNKISSVKTGDLDDGYIGQATEHYIQDCVMFELSRPGTTLSMSAFLSGNDLLSAFGQAANPAVYTLWFADSDGYRTGVSETCDVAFTNIQSYYSDTNITDKWLTANCGTLGFNTTDTTQLTQCKQIIQDSALYTTGSSMTANKFMQQAALSAFLNNVAMNGGVEQSIKAVGNGNMMSSLYGMGIMANEYMPLIRSIVTAVAISLLPFIVLFSATSIVGRAMRMAAGFFVFLTAWGVTDALTHGLATNYAYQFFQQARDNNLGYASIMAMPSSSAKSVGLFGLIRTMGIVLAAIISKMFVDFGGEALAHMAGNLGGQVQSAGASAGRMGTQEGTASAVREYAGSRATVENAHAWNLEERAGSLAMQESSGIARASETQAIMGGSSIAAGRRTGAAGAVGDSQRALQTEESSAALGGNAQLTQAGAQVGAAHEVGNIQSTARNAKAFFGDDSFESMVSMQKLEQHGLLDERSAAAANKALGRADGKGPFHAGMKVNHHDWGATDDGNLMMLGASYQDGTGSFRVHDGMITESGTMTGRQLLDRASELEKRGHVEAAAGMRKLVGRDVVSSDGRHHGTAGRGRGLLANESATFMEKKSFDGKSAEIGVRHGSDVSWYDTSSDKQGRTVDHGDHMRVGDTIDRGDHTTLGNTVTLNEGTSLPAQSAAQMALERKPLLVSQITKPGISNDERDAQRLAVAASVADGMGSLIKRSGSSQDYSGLDGSVGGKVFGFGGAASTGYRTTDQYDSSLMAQHYNEVLKTAHHDAVLKGLNKQGTDVLAAERLQGAVKEEVAYFEKHGKWSYGATGGVTRLGKAIIGDDKDKRD
jgi:hypothetical protein